MANFYKPRYKFIYRRRKRVWPNKDSRFWAISFTARRRRGLGSKASFLPRQGFWWRQYWGMFNKKWRKGRFQFLRTERPTKLRKQYTFWRKRSSKPRAIKEHFTRFVYKIRMQKLQLFLKFYGKMDFHSLKSLFFKAYEQKRLHRFQYFLSQFEQRADVMLFRMRFLPTIFACHHFIRYYGVLINKMKVNYPYTYVRIGDVLSVPKALWHFFYYLFEKKIYSRLHIYLLGLRRKQKHFVKFKLRQLSKWSSNWNFRTKRKKILSIKRRIKRTKVFSKKNNSFWHWKRWVVFFKSWKSPGRIGSAKSFSILPYFWHKYFKTFLQNPQKIGSSYMRLPQKNTDLYWNFKAYFLSNPQLSNTFQNFWQNYQKQKVLKGLKQSQKYLMYQKLFTLRSRYAKISSQRYNFFYDNLMNNFKQNSKNSLSPSSKNFSLGLSKQAHLRFLNLNFNNNSSNQQYWVKFLKPKFWRRINSRYSLNSCSHTFEYKRTSYKTPSFLWPWRRPGRGPRDAVKKFNLSPFSTRKHSSNSYYLTIRWIRKKRRVSLRKRGYRKLFSVNKSSQSIKDADIQLNRNYIKKLAKEFKAKDNSENSLSSFNCWGLSMPRNRRYRAFSLKNITPSLKLLDAFEKRRQVKARSKFLWRKFFKNSLNYFQNSKINLGYVPYKWHKEALRWKREKRKHQFSITKGIKHRYKNLRQKRLYKSFFKTNYVYEKYLRQQNWFLKAKKLQLLLHLKKIQTLLKILQNFQGLLCSKGFEVFFFWMYCFIYFKYQSLKTGLMYTSLKQNKTLVFLRILHAQFSKFSINSQNLQPKFLKEFLFTFKQYFSIKFCVSNFTKNIFKHNADQKIQGSLKNSRIFSLLDFLKISGKLSQNFTCKRKEFWPLPKKTPEISLQFLQNFNQFFFFKKNLYYLYQLIQYLIFSLQTRVLLFKVYKFVKKFLTEFSFSSNLAVLQKELYKKFTNLAKDPDYSSFKDIFDLWDLESWKDFLDLNFEVLTKRGSISNQQELRHIFFFYFFEKVQNLKFHKFYYLWSLNQKANLFHQKFHKISYFKKFSKIFSRIQNQKISRRKHQQFVQKRFFKFTKHLKKKNQIEIMKHLKRKKTKLRKRKLKNKDERIIFLAKSLRTAQKSSEVSKQRRAKRRPGFKKFLQIRGIKKRQNFWRRFWKYHGRIKQVPAFLHWKNTQKYGMKYKKKKKRILTNFRKSNLQMKRPSLNSQRFFWLLPSCYEFDFRTLRGGLIEKPLINHYFGFFAAHTQPPFKKIVTFLRKLGY